MKGTNYNERREGSQGSHMCKKKKNSTKKGSKEVKKESQFRLLPKEDREKGFKVSQRKKIQKGARLKYWV